MNADIAMQKVIEGLNITRVTGGQPADNHAHGLIHAQVSSHKGDRSGENRAIPVAHRQVGQITHPSPSSRRCDAQLPDPVAYFQRKWTKTRPKLFESFSTRW